MDDDGNDLKHLYMELRGLMWSLAKQSRQAMEQNLQSEGVEMSWLQHGVIRVLMGEGTRTISELSKVFQCDPSTLVPAVDALERKGFVVRERDAKDRRRVLLSLTSKAIDLTRRLDVVHDDDPILNSLALMERTDREQLVVLLRQLIAGTPDGEATVQNIQNRVRLNSVDEGQQAALQVNTQGEKE